jgi:hypothetical protein
MYEKMSNEYGFMLSCIFFFSSIFNKIYIDNSLYKKEKEKEKKKYFDRHKYK